VLSDIERGCNGLAMFILAPMAAHLAAERMRFHWRGAQIVKLAPFALLPAHLVELVARPAGWLEGGGGGERGGLGPARRDRERDREILSKRWPPAGCLREAASGMMIILPIRPQTSSPVRPQGKPNFERPSNLIQRPFLLARSPIH